LSNGVEARSDNAKAKDSMLSKVRPLLIGWKVGGLNPQWPHHYLLYGHPWDSHETKAVTRIYIWAVLKDDTVRPEWPMRGGVRGKGAPPIPTS